MDKLSRVWGPEMKIHRNFTANLHTSRSYRSYLTEALMRVVSGQPVEPQRDN